MVLQPFFHRMAAEFPLKIEPDDAVAPALRARNRDDERAEVGGKKRGGGGYATGMTWQQHRDRAIGGNGRKRAKMEE
jgi:hypothetical protein